MLKFARASENPSLLNVGDHVIICPLLMGWHTQESGNRNGADEVCGSFSVQWNNFNANPIIHFVKSLAKDAGEAAVGH